MLNMYHVFFFLLTYKIELRCKGKASQTSTVVILKLSFCQKCVL